MDAVKHEIQLLYGPNTPPDQRSSANQKLQQFQQQAEAWQVANALLQEHDQTFAVFGATLLKLKIAHDLHQLDAQQQTSLREAVLLMANSTQTNKLVRLHLLVALVHLAVLQRAWQDPFGDCVQRMQTHLPILLEFTRMLPEEIHRQSQWLDNERVNQLLLTNTNARIAFDLVLAVTQNPQSTGAMKHEAITVCCAWIKTRTLQFHSVDWLKMQQFMQMVMDLTWRAVNDQEGALESLVDVIIEVAADNASLEATESQMRVRGLLLQQLTQLCAMTVKSPVAQLANDSRRELVRLYTEVAELFTEQIVLEWSNYESLIDNLVASLAYRAEGEETDLRINQISFGFWFELTRIIMEQDGMLAGDQQMSTLHMRAIGAYKQLAVVLTQQFQYPDMHENDTDGMTAAEKEDFRDFRHAAGDVVKDCVLVIGQVEALKIPFAKLTQAYQAVQSNQPFKWQQVEGALFALRTMGGQVQHDETTILPQIMKMIPSVVTALESKFGVNYGTLKIRYSSTLVLGRYSHWTCNHPEFIPEHLQFIYKGFAGASEELCGAAALSLKYLCESCGPHMVPYMSDLHQLYVSAVTNLKRYEVLELTEAMALIINCVPLEPQTDKPDITTSLKAFCVPICEQLHTLSQQLPAQLAKFNELLERLTLFFKRVAPEVPKDQPHPCLLLFDSCQSIFNAVLMRPDGADEQYGVTIDLICRLYKKVLLSYEGHPHMTQVVQQSLAAQLAASFALTKNPALLWVGAHIVRRFGKLCVEAVRVMVEQQFTAVFQLMPNVATFNAQHETINDFVRLMTACTTAMPAMFYTESVLAPVVDFVACGLQSNHVNVVENLLSFTGQMIAEVANDKASGHQQFYPVVRIVISSRLHQLLRAVMDGATGQNGTNIPYNNGLFGDISYCLMHVSDTVTPQVFGQALTDLLAHYQQMDMQQHQQQRLTDDVMRRVLEGYREAVERTSSGPLKVAMQTLAIAYKVKMGRRAQQ